MIFNCLGPEVTCHFLSQSIGQPGRLGMQEAGHMEYCSLPTFLSPKPQAENVCVCVAGWSRVLVRQS